MSNEVRDCPMNNSKLSSAQLIETVKKQMTQGNLHKQNLVWLELTGCSGNIISLLDGSNPDFTYLITQMTNFIYNNSLSANEGQDAMEQLFGI